MKSPQVAEARWPVAVPLNPLRAETPKMADETADKAGAPPTVLLSEKTRYIVPGVVAAFIIAVVFGAGMTWQRFINQGDKLASLEARVTAAEAALRRIDDVERQLREVNTGQDKLSTEIARLSEKVGSFTIGTNMEMGRVREALAEKGIRIPQPREN